MTMLGAQLEDLTALADQLRRTAGDLAGVREGSLALSSRLVTTVRDSAQSGLAEIDGQLTTMATSVATAVAQADTAQWTGANAERFRAGAAEFQTGMDAGRAATEEAFTAFSTHIGALADALETYVAGFGTALSGAEASSEQMSSAVEAQRAGLDQVMNTGLTVG